jgi:hypothetical protein
MMDFLLRIEESGLATWIRTADSYLAYPLFLFLHTVGLGMVSGLSMVVGLRILGFAKGIPLRSLERLFPFMWFGFLVNALSGLGLLMAAATTKAVSGVFWIKLLLIALAVADMKLIRSRVFRDAAIDKVPVSSEARVLALAAMFLWAGAVAAGRLMAYVGAGAAEAGISRLILP